MASRIYICTYLSARQLFRFFFVMLGTFPQPQAMPTFFFISFSSLIFFSRGAARALQEGNDIDTLILECEE